MPIKKLKEFLDKEHIDYVVLTHSPAFTSQEIAATAHVSGKVFAKTVIVKMDGQFAMVVLPADDQVDFTKLKEETGKSQVDLAAESDFKDRFGGCEVGAMPPFGNLYDMPVYVSDQLDEDDPLIFNSGSHSELMQLAYKDFDRLVKPTKVSM